MSRTDNTEEIERQRFIATLAAPIAGALIIATEAEARDDRHNKGRSVESLTAAEISDRAVVIAEAIYRRAFQVTP